VNERRGMVTYREVQDESGENHARVIRHNGAVCHTVVYTSGPWPVHLRASAVSV